MQFVYKNSFMELQGEDVPGPLDLGRSVTSPGNYAAAKRQSLASSSQCITEEEECNRSYDSEDEFSEYDYEQDQVVEYETKDVDDNENVPIDEEEVPAAFEVCRFTTHDPYAKEKSDSDVLPEENCTQQFMNIKDCYSIPESIMVSMQQQVPARQQVPVQPQVPVQQVPVQQVQQLVPVYCYPQQYQQCYMDEYSNVYPQNGYPYVNQNQYVQRFTEQPSFNQMYMQPQVPQQQVPQPQNTTYESEPELGITNNLESDGVFRARWTLPARRITGNEVTAVSPQFHIDGVPFKLTLQPYFSEEHKRPGSKKGKGQACFRASHGLCVMQLKCEGDNGPKVVARLFVEDSASRGPIIHDFSERMIAGLSKEDEQWSLLTYIKDGQMTLTIGVEYILEGRA